MKKIFSYLSISLLFILYTSCSYMIKDFKNAANAYFTVIKNFEAVDTEEYDLNLQETLFIKGDPSKYITEEKGFSLDSRNYDKASNTLTLNFKRNEVTLTFHLEGGVYKHVTETDVPKSGKYGATFYPLDHLEMAKTDFEFSGWSLEPNGASINLPYTFPAEDCDYYALWNSVDNNKDAVFTVKTRLQNKDDDGYTVIAENIHMGEVGEETKIYASQKEGFVPLQITQQVVTADGSTVVFVDYNRKEMTYTFYLSHDEEEVDYCHWTEDPDDIEDQVKVISGRYESSAAGKLPEDPVHDEIDGEVWEFAGWNEVNGSPDEIFLKDRVFYAIWKKTISKYTVEHYFEALEEDVEPVKLAEYADRIEKNTTGEYTNAQPYKTTPGFTVDKIENVVLEETGTVAKVFYRRANVLITLDPNGGVWSNGDNTSKYISGKYGRPVTELPVSSDLSELVGWITSEGQEVSSLPSTFPATSQIYIAKWKKIKSVFSVKYWYQNIEDDEYVQNKLITETHIDLIGEKTTGIDESIREKLSEGFEFSPNPESFDIVVPAEDDTEINVYFKRKIVNVKIDVNGATWEDGTKEPKFYIGKFGAVMNIPTSTWNLHSVNHREVSIDDGKTWNPVERPSTFPAYDSIYRIIWDDLGVPYVVKYYEQNINGTGYSLIGSETLSGASGDETSVTPEPRVGFATKTVEQKQISANGKTVVEVYYDRKEIKLTFGPGDHGKWSNEEPSVVITGLYGQNVTAPDTNNLISDELYEYDGWMLAKEGASEDKVLIPSTFPAEDVVYKVKWSKIESTEVGGNNGSWIVDAGATDIGIIKTNIVESSYLLHVKVPYAGNWTFVWTIDGVESTLPSITMDFEKGNHQISVVASCNGAEYTSDTTLSIN